MPQTAQRPPGEGQERHTPRHDGCAQGAMLLPPPSKRPPCLDKAQPGAPAFLPQVSSAAYDRNGTPPILDSSRPVALTGLQSPLAVKPFQAHGMTTFRPVAQRANNMI